MEETKSKMLRRAILAIPFDRDEVPDSITTDDVLHRWPQLSVTGYAPYHVVQLANALDESAISDDLMKTFMDALNWYNKFHS